MDAEIFISSGVWIVTALLMLCGLSGSVIPGVPGSSLILVGYIWHYFAMGDEAGAGLIGLAFFLVFYILTLVIDYVAGIFGAKLFGGTKWGMLGAFIGAIIGVIFFNIPGLIFGPFVGTATFEYCFAKQELQKSLKSGTGSMIGALCSMLINLVFSTGMIVIFLVDELW